MYVQGKLTKLWILCWLILLNFAAFDLQGQYTNRKSVLNRSQPLTEEGVIVVKIDESVPVSIPGSDENNNLKEEMLGAIFDLESMVKIESLVNGKVPQARSAHYGKSKYLRGIYKIRLKQGENKDDVIRRLQQYHNVIYAEPLFLEQPLLIPNDPNISQQNHLSVIKAFDAWDVTTGDPSITIGIIDTGAQLDNVDLRDNLAINESDPINGLDDDGNGYIDDHQGWDFADNDNNPVADFSGHGTHVTGVSSATANNNYGVAGVGYNSSFVPLKIFRSSNNSSNNSYEAIIYAADQGYQVINLSWGSAGSFSQFNQDVINYAALERDVVIVAAAGNTNEALDFYPASYDNVISVGATDVADNKASFGTFSYKIDLMAPGENVYSTTNGDGFGFRPGSSFAAPQVAGAAALVRVVFPQWNALQVAEQIRVTADDIYDVGTNSQYFGQLGKGRLNVFNAVTNTIAKSIRVNELSYADEFGEFAFFDDSVTVQLNFINVLNPTTQGTVTVTSESAFVSISNGGLIELGALNELATSQLI